MLSFDSTCSLKMSYHGRKDKILMLFFSKQGIFKEQYFPIETNELKFLDANMKIFPV